MLDEMSPHDDDLRPVEAIADTVTADRSVDEGRLAAVRAAVAEVFTISRTKFNPDDDIVAVFLGTLRLEPEAAYAQLDARLAPLGLTPIFRERRGEQLIQVLNVRFDPQPRSWWPNLILFVLTILSLLYTGAGIALGEAVLADPTRQLTEFWRGWPYALGIVLILGAHELGHYFAARYHRVPVTLPYFIPLPFGFFGTLGAFIQLRAPMRNRKVLLDVGAAGPLVGLIVAVPVLLIGLATAEVQPLPTEAPFVLEGNSILYAAAKFVTFGQLLPGAGMDVWMNQLAQAGWTGLFVTGLNLIPIGQLDGGHVLYTLLGDRARLLYLPVVGIMAVLAVVVSEAWFLWVFLLMLFGRAYATPLDMLTPLDGRRRLIAVLALVVFVLVFVPDPLRIVEPLQLGPQESAFGGGRVTETDRALESAVVIVPPPAVAAFADTLREQYLGIEYQLVPAHITVMYPFVSPGTVASGPDAALLEKTRDDLRQACAEAAPFTITLDRYATFPNGGILYLALAEPTPVVALQERLLAAFPDYPPYSGQHAEFMPHLTVGYFASPALLAAAPRPAFTPFTFVVETLHFLYGDYQTPQRWATAAMISLGG